MSNRDDKRSEEDHRSSGRDGIRCRTSQTPHFEKGKRSYADLSSAFSTYRGILTGYNKAFLVDDTQRNRLIAEDPKSPPTSSNRFCEVAIFSVIEQIGLTFG